MTKAEGSVKGISYKVFVHLPKTKISIYWTKIEVEKFRRDTSNFISPAELRLSKEKVMELGSCQMPEAPRGLGTRKTRLVMSTQPETYP